MASLKDIRVRIGSVKNTQKITRAMKLIAAAKFAKANNAVRLSKPYTNALNSLVSKLLSEVEGKENYSLLSSREEKKVLVVLVATDRGFCGGLNTNLFKNTQKFLTEKAANNVVCDIAAYGKRAIKYAQKIENNTVYSEEGLLNNFNSDLASDKISGFVKQFEELEYDAIYLSFVEFKSAIAQKPKTLRLVPLEIDPVGDEKTNAHTIIEPSVELMLKNTLSKSVINTFFHCLLEAAASEQGARMTAMESATNNAEEVVKDLTVEYNRARQAAITTELIEITSGAEAL